MDSPELRPLPPLVQNNRRNPSYGETEEDEEFYSPRASLIGTGSASRRDFSATPAANFDTRSDSSSSSGSNNSASPTRSISLSISPPVSSSPVDSMAKSPDLVAVIAAPAGPPPLVMTQLADLKSSPSFSSVSSSSLERESKKSLTSSPNFSINFGNYNNYNNNSVMDEFYRSPSLSPMSSPDRPLLKSNHSSPQRSDGSDQTIDSPSRLSKLIHLGSMRFSKSGSSSPEKALNSILSPVSSPRKSNSSDGTIDSPSKLGSKRISKLGSSSPEKALNSIQNTVPVSVIPPPPPPPPPAGYYEIPVVTPSACKPSLRPPALVAPLRPIVPLVSLNSVSPMELPMNTENEERDGERNGETPKLKLKPLHWDKVRASSDREMVWDQLKSSSFRLNEEMIETLFVVNTPNSNAKDSVRRPILPSPNHENRVLDPKKAQNIAISLRALNVTVEEVSDALAEGNAEALGAELLESLLKMAPSKEEERKLKEFKDDSPIKLGPAEKFLKALLDIPFAFRRINVMLYMANFESEVEYLKKSFDTLEAACEELRNSRMFLKLLEAVLKTGNRMNVGTNRGDAHAFKLDTLLKLVDVKGADGKTTLLHFVVQEIIRTEGSRLSGEDQYDDAKCRKLGLEVVSGLSSELSNVKKAAAMDSEVLCNDVAKLSKGIKNVGEVVQLCESMGSMSNFVKVGEEEIIRVQAQESVALSLVKEITEYFHGNSAKEEAHPFRIFMIVRDFLTVLDRVCKEVGTINERTIVSSAHKFPVPVNPMMQPPISGFSRRMDYNLSDDES